MTADLTPTTDAIEAAIVATILAGTDEPSDRDRELAHLYAPGIVRGLAPVAQETLTRLLDQLAGRDATIAQLLAAVEYLYGQKRIPNHDREHTEPVDTCAPCAYMATRNAEIGELILRLRGVA